ncbi:F-box only protein 39-like isoform X2 [Homarus americanus]|uniref:F-box only protein 39-like isoform X2 n=1 Tax=Homarus americanus TaxID=6706 RepID=UPI001C47453D|nr:F-box only protein 39-like isoform X2 [Homarus americanus]
MHRVPLFDSEMGELVSHGKQLYKKEVVDPNHVYSEWNLLPDLLLERVFQHLTLDERYNASMICRNWSRAFHFPRVWYTFELHDTLLTKRKFNYCAGWQKLLDHIRVTIFLTKKGMHIRTLIFPPMNNLFNLYEFLNVSLYMHNNCPGTLDRVHTLRFSFACQHTEQADDVVFGTGGQILSMFKKVMGVFSELKTLELRDLLLEGCEGLHLLDEVCVTCCETLRTLTLVNVMKLPHTLLHPGAFVNLETLVISPQSIGDDLLELLGYSKVRNMYIVQNKYTENGQSLSYKAWKQCRAANPRLRVHLCSEGSCKNEIIWQQQAPVRSIVYNSPYAKIDTPVMLTIIELYKRNLEVFAHKQLPRFYMPRSFHDRIDSSLLLLVRQCPYIHTLVVREKVSTATVLLVAHTAKNLMYFYLRRNAIILKADWPFNPDWTPEFYEWLCKNARSYEAMEREVSQILGYKWQSLTDKQFKMINIDLGKSYYMFS